MKWIAMMIYNFAQCFICILARSQRYKTTTNHTKLLINNTCLDRVKIMDKPMRDPSACSIHWISAALFMLLPTFMNLRAQTLYFPFNTHFSLNWLLNAIWFAYININYKLLASMTTIGVGDLFSEKVNSVSRKGGEINIAMICIKLIKYCVQGGIQISI